MRAIGMAWIALLTATAAWADSWAPADQIEALSDDGKIVATATAAKKDGPAMLNVGRKDGDRIVPLWQTNLSNHGLPYELRVCDDGEHVVTLDNYFGVGYGDDVLAFYSKAGQVRQYSLEQILGKKVRYEYEGGPPRSVSSIWWRGEGVEVIRRETGRELLCIWLGWEDRWLAWNMATGEAVVKPSPADMSNWNDAARQKALVWANGGGEAFSMFTDLTKTAAHFLGKLRRPEDRAVLVRLMSTTKDYCPSYSLSDAGKSLVGSSATRNAADEELAKWDGKQRDQTTGNGYTFLGSITGELRVAEKPGKHGSVFIYLLRDTAGEQEWSKAPTVLLMRYDDVQTSWGGTTRMGIRLDGIEPGRYWVKVIQFRKSPAEAWEPLPKRDLRPDFESTGRRVFEVKAAQTANIGAIECTDRFRR